MQVSIADARNTLTKLIHRAESGEVVHITRRGTPVAVLVSELQYERLGVHAARDCWQVIEEWRSKAAFDGPDLADEEVDGWRNRSPGRGFTWPDEIPARPISSQSQPEFDPTWHSIPAESPSATAS